MSIGYSLLLLGYKPVQHVTVLNTVGNCNCGIMVPPSYMLSVVDRNVVMQRIPVRRALYLPIAHVKTLGV